MSGNGRRCPTPGRFVHNIAFFVSNTVHPKGSANDILVVKYPDPDGTGTFTLACSPLDVSFQDKSDIYDWKGKNVEVAVRDEIVWLSINQLNSSNDEAFHKLPKEEVSETLARLKLNPGMNDVTFFLRKETIRAKIFLYNRETARFVVTDVDGTITKSDIMGAVKFSLGMDWTHKCASLFSHLKEQGYILIYLSGRPRGLAQATRDFLFQDVNQDGKTLPVGPVFVAPVGSTDTIWSYAKGGEAGPKIHILQAIRSLFSEGHNPFHAGFGNRPSDRISYRKVDISEDYIFTVNCKGKITAEKKGKEAAAFSLYDDFTKPAMSGYFPKVSGEGFTSEEASTSDGASTSSSTS